MDYKKERELTETEFVDYRRIFYGDNRGAADSSNSVSVPLDKLQLKKQREKRFMTVFLIQIAVCLVILSTALVLRYARPETFENISSVLSGFYENNITLSDLNELLGERISDNDALATFFNFTQD